MQHALRRAPRGRVLAEGIEAVFEHVEIDGTHVNRAEVVKFMEDLAEIKLLIIMPNAFYEAMEPH